MNIDDKVRESAGFYHMILNSWFEQLIDVYGLKKVVNSKANENLDKVIILYSRGVRDTFEDMYKANIPCPIIGEYVKVYQTLKENLIRGEIDE